MIMHRFKCMCSWVYALVASICMFALRVFDLPSVEKLKIEVAQNAAHKVTDNRKPVSIGSGSGDSPLSFVSMLKAINSRSVGALT